jgi:hypothetical protein
MANLVNKVKKNLEGQGRVVGEVLRSAVKETAKQAPLLVNPEIKAGATAVKIGDLVAQKVAESTPAAKYGKAGGEIKTVRTSSEDPITVRRDMKQPSQAGDPHLGALEDKNKISISKPKSATYTSPKNSPEQRAGVQKASDTKRANAIEGAAQTATSAAHPEVQKLANSANKVITGVKLVEEAARRGTQADHTVTQHDRKTGKAK